MLLHHVFGEVNGKKGAWGHAIGGMGAITQAMARPAPARGVEIRTERAGARGARRARPRGRRGDGRRARLSAPRAVVSNLNPKLLYLRLVDPAVAAGGLQRAHRRTGAAARARSA